MKTLILHEILKGDSGLGIRRLTMRTEENSTGPSRRLIRCALRIGLFALLSAALLSASALCWAAPQFRGARRGGWGGGPRAAAFRFNHTGGRGFRGQQAHSQGGQHEGAGHAGAAARPGQEPGMRQGTRPGQEHLPAWWQAHRGLSPQQQADALRREPGFQNLPPGQQQRLLNRLHNFNQRPPEVQQRMLDRMEMFERLSPERQQEVRGASQAFSRMSPERKAAMRHAFQELRNMPPEEREKMLNSSYGAQFTPQERTVLGNMLSIEPYQPHVIQPYFGR